MKRKLILSILTLLAFTGCSQKPDEKPQSLLRGTFTFNDAITVKYSKTIQDGNYLYCRLYPQRDMMAEGQDILYRTDQRLKLNRDYTYSYQYTVILGNPGDWGNLEVAKLHVNITGTFTYTLGQTETSYIVHLSNPTGGIEEIYGSSLNNVSWLGNWTMHSSPDQVLDFTQLSKLSSYTYDEYVCSRKVIVTKAQSELENNSIEDDIFYPYILEDFGRYSNY